MAYGATQDALRSPLPPLAAAHRERDVRAVIMFNYFPETLGFRLIKLRLVLACKHSGGQRRTWPLLGNGGMNVIRQIIRFHNKYRGGVANCPTVVCQ